MRLAEETTGCTMTVGTVNARLGMPFGAKIGAATITAVCVDNTELPAVT